MGIALCGEAFCFNARRSEKSDRHWQSEKSNRHRRSENPTVIGKAINPTVILSGAKDLKQILHCVQNDRGDIQNDRGGVQNDIGQNSK